VIVLDSSKSSQPKIVQDIKPAACWDHKFAIK